MSRSDAARRAQQAAQDTDDRLPLGSGKCRRHEHGKNHFVIRVPPSLVEKFDLEGEELEQFYNEDENRLEVSLD